METLGQTTNKTSKLNKQTIEGKHTQTGRRTPLQSTQLQDCAAMAMAEGEDILGQTTKETNKQQTYK